MTAQVSFLRFQLTKVNEQGMETAVNTMPEGTLDQGNADTLSSV